MLALCKIQMKGLDYKSLEDQKVHPDFLNCLLSSVDNCVECDISISGNLEGISTEILALLCVRLKSTHKAKFQTEFLVFQDQ